jgi:two-component system OmpR family sensor kinase
MTPDRSTLSRILTRKLAWIAAAVVLVNAVAVAAYYGSDRESLEGEVVDRMMQRLEAALIEPPPRVHRRVREVFEAHPRHYAFALLDRNGRIVDAENAELIPAPATETGVFAQDWITRIGPAEDRLLVASHKVGEPEDKLRMVFVMRGDPSNLLPRALVAEFAGHIWLPILPVVLILIGANAFMIRRGLRPVAEAADWARRIRPGRPAPEPPRRALPAEIVDLVEATQRSLGRLNAALVAEKRRAAEVAHALRTPVAVLVARVDSLPDGETTTRLRADLAALSRTVQQVLASARADMLDAEDRASTDLAQSAGRVIATLAPFAYQNGAELSLEIDGSPPLAVADPDGVEVALSNLVENAILHAGPGLVEITVGPDSSIRVRDHGKGLPQVAQDRLFEPFWRGQEAPAGGAGLGLAIVERLQRAQGGSVVARAGDDGGSEFMLSFRPDPSPPGRAD